MQVDDNKSGKAKSAVEDISLMAEDLVKTVKGLVKEGNVRKITVKNEDGRVVATFPLSMGIMGALLAPTLAAVGALAALLTECTVTVERES